MNGEDHSLNALRAGEFRVEDIPDGGPSALVRMAAGAGDASGIAYTSTGALAVRALRATEGGAAVTATSGDDVDLNTVYELRLWRVVDSGASTAGGVRAAGLYGLFHVYPFSRRVMLRGCLGRGRAGANAIPFAFILFVRTTCHENRTISQGNSSIAAFFGPLTALECSSPLCRMWNPALLDTFLYWGRRASVPFAAVELEVE